MRYKVGFYDSSGNIIDVVQGDSARTLELEASDYTIPSGATAAYCLEKPSGLKIQDDATITDNTVVVPLTSQALSEVGENICQVLITKDGALLTSFSVIINVAEFSGLTSLASIAAITIDETNIFDKHVAEALDDFEEQAAEKAAETIESIPDDYTTLSNTVTDLKSAIIKDVNVSEVKASVATGNYDYYFGYALLPSQKLHINVVSDTPQFSIYKIISSTGDRELLATYTRQYIGDIESTEEKPIYGMRIWVANNPGGTGSININFSTDGIYTDIKNINDEISNINTGLSSIKTVPVEYRLTISGIDTLGSYAHAPVLYQADEIETTTSSDAYCGIEFYIKNPIVGQRFQVDATRTGGNNRVVRIYFRDKNGSNIPNGYEWSNIQYVPEGAETIYVLLAACWGDAAGAGTAVTFSDVKMYYPDYLNIVSDTQGDGDRIYYGEHISLHEMGVLKNRFVSNKWFEFSTTTIQDINNYGFNYNQSIAMYNGYVFLFKDVSGGTVFDYSNKTIISQFTYSGTDPESHQNSAQFTDIFYNSGDEFPLIIISRCKGENADEGFVYRITRSNTQFTFTLINKIIPTFTTYGCNWTPDNNNKLLYAVYYPNGDYTVTENNKLQIRAFNMPSASEIVSGNNISISESSFISKMEFDVRIIFQGSYGIGRKLFLTAQLPNKDEYGWENFALVIDVFENKMMSRIPIEEGLEPEGVAIYNNKLYCSLKNYSLTATTPLTIWELDLN